MSATDVVKAYHAAIEQGDWKGLDACITDDFTFSGPTVQPLDKRAFLSSMKALWAGFPDLSFNLRILGEQGNTVQAVTQITGTHKGNVIPPFPDKFLNIAPTGKKISLEAEPATYTLRGNLLVNHDVEPKRNGGWPGILKQLGVDYPYPLPDES